jgi:putative multiple sugar transport system permease protein
MAQDTVASSGTPQQRGAIGAYLRHNIRDYGLLISLIVIMVFFQFMTGGTLSDPLAGTLFKPLNLTNLVLQNSYIVIMALGMLLIIVAGHIDLSVGSVVGFVGAVAAVMMVQWHVHFAIVIIACLLLGAAIGAAQGYFTAFLNIPAFIVTLAGMLVFRGLALWMLGGMSVGPFPVGFQLLSTGFIPDLPGGTFQWVSMTIGTVVTAVIIFFNIRQRMNQQKHDLAEEPFAIFIGRNVLIAIGLMALCFRLSQYKGLPNVMVIMSALIALYAFMAANMTIGRRIYALGGNEKAARLSGIKTDRLTFYAFLNMGVLAALAGLVFTARLNSATPQAGLGFELDVIAACFIGGASPTGGVGKIIGAVIGAFIVGVMNNGMVLLAAVCLDVYYKRKS